MWFGADAATAIMKRGEKRVAASCEDIRRTRRRTRGDCQGCNFQKAYSARKKRKNDQTEALYSLPLREQSGAGVGVEPLRGIEAT